MVKSASPDDWELAKALHRAEYYDRSDKEATHRWELLGDIIREDYLAMARKLKETHRVISKDSIYL